MKDESEKVRRHSALVINLLKAQQAGVKFNRLIDAVVRILQTESVDVIEEFGFVLVSDFSEVVADKIINLLSAILLKCEKKLADELELLRNDVEQQKQQFLASGSINPASKKKIRAEKTKISKLGV